MNRFHGLEDGTDELSAGQQRRRRHRGQTHGRGRGGEGGGRGRDERRERPGTTHPPCVEQTARRRLLNDSGSSDQGPVTT